MGEVRSTTLMAFLALDERYVQPLTRARRMGDRDLVLDDAEAIQYTAGSGPTSRPYGHSLTPAGASMPTW
jgi:hypothetical protein